MSAEFRESDAQILADIIEHANQRYLRESRVNQKSSFNILRVLSAYKETSQQYSSRKDHIYNWIIYITKHYNPQTLKQWINAIHQISQMHKKPNKQSPTKTSLTNPFNFNRTVNQFYQTHSYQLETEQNNPYQHKSQMELNIYKDYIVNNRSRQLKSSQEFRYAPNSSKMHYISFEPDNENKQNYNSSNNSYHTYKSKGLKIQNLPTRTPGDQSFIHTLPMSYGSPGHSSITKITHNTKDIIQVQNQEEQTEEWVNMKTRADIFHQINLKMKSFSALLANFQAFQLFQQIYRKTHNFEKRMLCSRFFKSFQSFTTQRRQQKYIQDGANAFYQNKLLKKSFKIFYVLYQLKIHNPNRKQININKFTPINFQFLLSIMFCPSQIDDQSHQYRDTPKSIRHKSKYFIRVQDFEKMEMLSQYFNCNLKVNKEEISQLFGLYNKSRLNKAFGLLKKNVRLFKKQIESVHKNVKKSAIKYILKISRINMTNKACIALMLVRKERLTKEKCFNALLQFQISKKVYAKREQYIENHHKQNVTRIILNIWKHRKEEVKTKKLGLQACVKQGTVLITKTMGKKYLKHVLNNLTLMKVKEQKEQEKLNRQVCRKIIHYLKSRANERKIHNQIRSNSNFQLKKAMFMKWRRISKICYSLSKLIKNIERNIFNQLKIYSSLVSKSNTLQKYLSISSYERGLKQIRICHNLDKLQISNKIQQSLKIIQKQEYIIFIKISRHELRLRKQSQKQKDISEKCSALLQMNDKTAKKSFIKQLLQKRDCQKILKNKKIIMKNIMGNRSIKLDSDEVGNLGQTYTRCHTVMKKQFIQQIQEAWRFSIKVKLVNEFINKCTKMYITKRIKQLQEINCLRKGEKRIKEENELHRKKNVIVTIKKLHQITKNKELKATEKHNKCLKFKSLLGFARAILYTDNLITTLKNVLLQKRKAKCSKRFCQNLTKNLQTTKRTQKLKKVMFFNSLKKNKQSRKKYEGKSDCILALRKNRFFTKYLQYQKLMGWRIEQKLKEERALKKIAVMKLSFAIFRYILCKKQIYMAYKFKAIQLCKLSFKALRNHKHKTENPNETMIEKKKRMHQRVSTQQFSSL